MALAAPLSRQMVSGGNLQVMIAQGILFKPTSKKLNNANNVVTITQLRLDGAHYATKEKI